MSKSGWVCSAGLVPGVGFVLSDPTRAEAAEPKIAPERIAQLEGWLPVKPSGFGPSVSERVAWEKLAKAASFASVVASANALVAQPVPALPDDLYLDYSRTGNRDRCQKVLFARGARLLNLTLAECLENFKGRTVEMDLRATAVAWELATVDHLLGEKLAPATRALLRENVERRVLAPFQDMIEGRRKEIHWLRATHNWNAVCLAGVTGAALALRESPHDRAWFIAAAEQYIGFFLRGFTSDGYCSEGVGYWNYGFGHFLMMGEDVRQATSGKVDLLADPRALQPALFCRHAEIANGIFPSISDVHPGSRPDGQFVRYICERFDLPSPAGAAAEFVKPGGSLAGTMLFSFLPEPLPRISHASLPQESGLRTWFKDGGVLICRAAGGVSTKFAAVLKGGHNAENHNHNDVGSFSVVCGKAMVVCDPGAEVYTARTFGAHRYDSKVLSSFGHAVPIVGGKLQRTGPAARAEVLRADFSEGVDTLALDIHSAYDVPALKRLERTFSFRRTGTPTLVVHDDVAFEQPEKFETALVTWGECKKVSENEWVFQDAGGAVRVRIDTGGEPFTMHTDKLDEDVHTPKKPLRVGISLNSPVKTCSVSLTIQPTAE